MAAPDRQQQPSIRLGTDRVTRRFGAVLANDAVSLAVRRGSVHAIVGGNGAGKSTLMRILQGLDRPDEGSVIVDGGPVTLAGPADAFARGIGMVHQEFMLADGLTLLENLVLAKEPVDGLGRVDRARALAEARRLERLAGVSLDWDVPAETAPVHVRQIVEILRLLYRGADVLILDEPTAVLAPAQVRELIALLRSLRDSGHTVLFISHKLDEVLAVADDVTVIRAGRVVGSFPAAEARKDRLAELMIGEALSPPTRRPADPGPLALEAAGLTVAGPGGRPALADFDLVLRGGEIVGLAGVAGNGQDELTAALVGLVSAERGAVRLAGTDVTGADLRRRRQLGLSYLSPDRAAEGLCLAASIADNAICGHHARPRFSRGGILRRSAIARHVEALLDRFGVKRASAAQPTKSLSGGNQQRVAVARELDGDPKVLVACQPTRGVDIRGIAFIHQCLLDYRARGGAVLLVSEELEEVLSLSDRVVVLHNGRKSGELAREAAEPERVGRLMLGEAA